MKVKILEWDSNFFEKKIGLIEPISEIEIFSNVENFDLFYVYLKEDKFFEIEHFVSTYSGIKVVFSKILSKNNSTPDSFIYSANDTVIDKEQIYNLAFESGKYSRFKLDCNFEQNQFEALYKSWVDNSFNKDFADFILVYKNDNVIQGFITYKIYENYATIGLLGVSPTHQGKGIGQKLLRTVEDELIRKLIKELRIPTQLSNEQACKFYIKQGYNIIEQTVIKHFWRL